MCMVQDSRSVHLAPDSTPVRSQRSAPMRLVCAQQERFQISNLLASFPLKALDAPHSYEPITSGYSEFLMSGFYPLTLVRYRHPS